MSVLILMLRCRLVQVALMLVLTALPASSAEEGARALALAKKVQAHHQTVKDLKARFVQTYVSGLLGREVVERGSVAIKRPDRMLWKYERPEEKIFVSDGRTSYFYVPADRQVIVRDAAGNQGVALHLLSGRSDLLREFQVFSVPEAANRLRLIPQKEDAEVSELVLEAEPSGRIVWLEILDLQGNRSAFRFEDVKENVGLSDRLFQFEIPKGVEVVTG
jgi:outer membrane lipoprotein carrier protein